MSNGIPRALGFDVSVGLNTTTFECLLEHGYSFMVQRLWRSLCGLDSRQWRRSTRHGQLA
jgi:hypothetical protein